MKLFAQYGSQASDKIIRGLEENVIDGVIYSPRFLKPEKMSEKMSEAFQNKPSAELFIDPEYYATKFAGSANANLGYLDEWPYFVPQKRRDLVDTTVIDGIINSTIQSLSGFPVSGIISPNICIKDSFDSMEAGISMNFIKRAGEIKTDKPLYVTLTIHWRALLNIEAFKTFINDITSLPKRPEGFYILIGGDSTDENSELVQSEIISSSVISGWMFLNYVLILNGFKIINGYSDMLTPFLGSVGCHAGATGWWTNLRCFNMGKFVKSNGGGRRPTTKYLSKKLLNRIRMDQRVSYSSIVPEIINNLSYDSLFEGGSDPLQTGETLQSWQAIKSLNDDIIDPDIRVSLNNLKNVIIGAETAYAVLSSAGISEGIESINEDLKSMDDAIGLFSKLAEL